MKKLNLLLFLFVSNFNTVFSQTTLSDEAIINSSYVLEVTVLDFNIVQDRMINFVSYKLLINKILKSKSDLSENDTIEMISSFPDNWEITPKGEISVYSNMPRSSIKGYSLFKDDRAILMLNSNNSDVGDTSVTFPKFSPYTDISNGFYLISMSFEYDSLLEKNVLTQKYYGFDTTFVSTEKFEGYLISNGINSLNFGQEKKGCRLFKSKKRRK